MSNYKSILVCVDLHPSCDEPTLSRAKIIADQYKATLGVIHAIEHVNAYGVAQAYPTVLDLEDQMTADAKKELQRLGEKYQISKDMQFVEIGSPKSVILNKASELKIDLVIVGSHGRHGISVLLGSTANAVLHHAVCDVLAVRVQ